MGAEPGTDAPERRDRKKLNKERAVNEKVL
jgi:hypothetical protein